MFSGDDDSGSGEASGDGVSGSGDDVYVNDVWPIVPNATYFPETKPGSAAAQQGSIMSLINSLVVCSVVISAVGTVSYC